MFWPIIGHGAKASACSVSPRDQKELHKLLSSGIQQVRVVLRALALLHLAEGRTAPEVACSLKKLTAKTIRMIGHRYRKGRLERALYEKQRPGAGCLSLDDRLGIVLIL